MIFHLSIDRCGAIGGGLGDAVLVADRCSAEALHAVAPVVHGCKVEDAAGHVSGGMKPVRTPQHLGYGAVTMVI